jgi:DNA-binding protein Fis
MSTLAPQPIPKNLREQMVQRISSMSEQDVAELYELVLLNEKIRLRQEISDQAEQENAAGLWTNLPELIRAYRASKKSA